MSLQEQTQTLSFGAEIKQLMKLFSQSLYSNKEIFLRELISNASDANDKLRYMGLTDAALYEEDSDLKVWIDIDKENKTLTVSDNGIGMNREEVMENLGTIAKSGTSAFREMLDNKASDSQLIGQFGVGFYSTFVVADKVTVLTRRAGTTANQGVYWESNGEGEYTIKNIEKVGRGTVVILHLKSDAEEFLEDFRIRGIIHKYSDHILFPIVMKSLEKKDKEDAAEPAAEVVNSAKALWTMSKNEIKDEDYKELYKHIAHDFEDPLDWAHNKVEGKLEYTSLLYIPARAPFDLYNRDVQRGIKLYVKRIFIMDDAEQLMPMYLRFVKGIVDSNDLPLNVSREILQSNKVIEKIRSGCVKRVLSLLEEMADKQPEKYQKFWQEFGAVLKEGPAEDYANKEQIANLLRFASTQNTSSEQKVALKDYVSRMKENQKVIYYLVADTEMAAKNSPLLEVFRKKNIEVLLMWDRVDEWLLSHLTEHQGKTLKSIAKGELDLAELGEEDTGEKEEQAKKEKELSDYLARMKKILGDKVKEVRLTYRLTNSPACVVFDEGDLSLHMQRMLQAAGQNFGKAKPILELNPTHPIVVKISAENNDEKFNSWSQFLLDQALLAEGEQLPDPAGFVKVINTLLLDNE